jgi:CMP-2-keto-3-deoxyoctulosonic acid synthetase
VGKNSQTEFEYAMGIEYFMVGPEYFKLLKATNELATNYAGFDEKKRKEEVEKVKNRAKGFFKNYNANVDKNCYYKHIGLYGFDANILLELIKLQPSELELAETLEQLRWLENGYSIKVCETNYESTGIDSPEDLKLLGL